MSLGVSRTDLEKINELFSGKNSDKMFAAGLLTNTRMNSGSRSITFSQQVAQYVIPTKPQFPTIYYGFENSFGKYADSLVKSEGNYRIVDVISKFLLYPRHIYYLVVQNILTHTYDVIEIQHHIKYAESHGVVKDQTEVDFFTPGMIIPEGQILSKAPSHDKDGNYCMGVRANMCYLSIPETEEDGYCVSDEFADKTSFWQVEESFLVVNNNTILPNLYGNSEEYKAFPDLFESVKNGILCARRQVNFAYAASELTENALSTILDNDHCIPGQGKVIDIEVFINNEEELANNSNRLQIMRYWIENKNFHKKIIDTLGPIVKQRSNLYSYKLKMFYERSIDFMNQDIKFASANGSFEFALIKFTTAYETKLKEGYKICDRHGSKGVVCHILPKDQMPIDAYGNRADIIQSPPSAIARANIAQNYEHELNFISNHIRRLMLAITSKGVDAQFQILYEYLSIVDLEQGQALKLRWKTLLKPEKIEFIASCIQDGIYIRQSPFSGNISFEKMDYLYTKYDIHPSRIRIKREFKKHGFQEQLQLVSDKNYFARFLNENNTVISKGHVPSQITNEDNIIKEISDKEFTFINEGYIPGVHPGDAQLVSYDNETEEVNQLALLETESFEEKLLQNWIPDTFIEKSNDDTNIIRNFLSKEPVIIAEKYFFILKHIPEGKLSARYIGSVSALGMPNKPTKSDTNGPINQNSVRCVTGETNILLKDKGFVRIDSCVNQTVTLWNGFEWSDVLIRNTGFTDSMYKVSLSNGDTIECTDYHGWFIVTENGYFDQKTKNYCGESITKIQTKDLKPQMKLKRFTYPIIYFSKKLDHAYERGIFCGDGYFSSRVFSPEAYMYGIKHDLIQYMQNVRIIQPYHDTFKRSHISFKEINDASEVKFDKTFVPVEYCVTDKIAWLAGLIDTDGYIRSRSYSDNNIEISSVNKDFLLQIQKMLIMLGCGSKIRIMKPAMAKMMPDGKGGLKEYQCKTCYRLLIVNQYVYRLFKLGLNKYLHRVKIDDNIVLRSDFDEKITHIINIEKIQYNTKISTYCGTESKRNSIMFSSIVSSNSGEMELLNLLIRIKPETVYRYLSEISKDPDMRSKLFNNLLYKDPLTLHNIEDPKNGRASNDIPPRVLSAFLMCMGFEIIDNKENDIYNEFDNLELTDKQLERIMQKQLELHPITTL